MATRESGHRGGVAGAVLSGGASRRMGRDKAAVEVGGIAMVRRVADALVGAGVEPVAMVGGDGDIASSHGLVLVPDRWPGEGPLGGVLTALGWSPAPLVMVVACDLPMLTTRTVEALVGGIGAEAAVCIAHSDRDEPLCAVWRVDRAREAVEAAFARGARAVVQVWGDLAVARVQVDPAELRNVNAIDDLPPR